MEWWGRHVTRAAIIWFVQSSNVPQYLSSSFTVITQARGTGAIMRGSSIMVGAVGMPVRSWTPEFGGEGVFF